MRGPIGKSTAAGVAILACAAASPIASSAVASASPTAAALTREAQRPARVEFPRKAKKGFPLGTHYWYDNSLGPGDSMFLITSAVGKTFRLVEVYNGGYHCLRGRQTRASGAYRAQEASQNLFNSTPAVFQTTFGHVSVSRGILYLNELDENDPGMWYPTTAEVVRTAPESATSPAWCYQALG